ncbi:GvpL/GvpF family gas vesicle protein [Pseudonocardia sp. DSM 110487]|uniref:GvpL/GvpF family gas vesicle protein n=1 Tax=Pseudonocardia sp. DSM 110487 TaxID=2865833 RepID=UPI001C6A242F|nr:GvpL/GvpF family gas vesicle protein [Pseudonocardia sp. DSM 110487]QYN38090.1 GvpL/GvpF family gas vesicle protein [Pseudonocardia sp. DSM 110487]
MSAGLGHREEQNVQQGEKVVYVYGIVPADVEVEPDVRGVGDPPDEVTIIRKGQIAALVSCVSPDKPLGTPEDLAAHAQLLDATAADAPVLPLRFGAVLTDERAVQEELLGEHHDAFKSALDQLEGRAEFIVKGRYEHDAVLREVVDESDDLAQLREQIGGQPEEATRNARIALGEAVYNAIEAKRERDTAKLTNALTGTVVEVNVRPATHEEDAVHLACLVETDRQGEFQSAVDEIAREWDGRIEMRVRGPLAPYDFVVTQTPGE